MKLAPTKSKIDRAGVALAKENFRDVGEMLELEGVFDEYRKSHLEPLSETTLELQRWLNEYGYEYYIAQRLKRKPQIIRKLNRLSVRLTQLQDIGGCRVIVEKNDLVDRIIAFLQSKITSTHDLKLDRITDYRERGRDVTGYRSVHFLLKRAGKKFELQLRSRIQHYWAESIERTSVIYGRHLKEGEGDSKVISYFQRLSDTFFEIESGRTPSPRSKLELDRAKNDAEDIIRKESSSQAIDSYVNEDIILALAEKEKHSRSPINNWIIVFDWSSGKFVSWDIVGKTPDEAIKSYVQYENQFPAGKNYEVVLIGSSNIATVRRTHSHYFGIESYENILENLDESIEGFRSIWAMDLSARQIILKLRTKKFWGKKSVAQDTLKNHYCTDVKNFYSSLDNLVEQGLVLRENANGPISLNIKARAEIDKLIS